MINIKEIKIGDKLVPNNYPVNRPDLWNEIGIIQKVTLIDEREDRIQLGGMWWYDSKSLSFPEPKLKYVYSILERDSAYEIVEELQVVLQKMGIHLHIIQHDNSDEIICVGVGREEIEGEELKEDFERWFSKNVDN